MEDTISTDEQDNEVNADQDSRHGGTPVSHYTIVHDVVPAFTCQDLKQRDTGEALWTQTYRLSYE